MKYALLLLIGIFSSISFGQIKYTGTISTPENDTLIGGQFGIYSQNDTSFIKGDLIVDNEFEFNNSKKPFFIKIFSVAHKDSFVLVEPNPSSGKFEIPTIALVSKGDLGEVTVRATRPMFQRSLKGIKVNVSNTPLAELETVFDVLKASPKIMSPDDENLEIIGKGTPKIYVDRQEIMSMDELRAIPAAFVDKIDIITNPSSRYSASGSGGVIEIYTLNYHMEGSITSIGLNGGVNIKAQPSLGGNINFNYKKKKFSINASLSSGFGKYISESTSTKTYTDSTGIIESSKGENRGNHFWGMLNLKMRYDINKKHSLTFGVKGWGGGSGSDNSSSSDIKQNSILNQLSNSSSESKNVWVAPTAHLSYKWSTDDFGSNFTARFQYNKTIRDNDNIDTSYFNNTITSISSNFKRQTISKDRPDVFTTYLDYVQVFDSTGWELAVGGFYSFLINGKIYDQFDRLDDQWVLDNQFSNSYDYTEQIGALYFDVEKAWEKFSFKLGLRGESTMINGFSNSLNSTILDTTYFNLFPSTSFMYKFNKNWNLTLSYNGRFNRPRFENYDPFIRQSDSLNIQYGNPQLLPEYAHVMSAEIGYKMGYSLEFSYTRANRPISTRSFVDSNTYITHSTSDNGRYNDSYSVSLSIPVMLKWWRGYHTIWGSYSNYVFTDNFYRDPFGNFTFGLSFFETFILPKKWNINSNLNVYTSSSGSSISEPVVYWSLGVSKKLLDGKLNLRFDVKNIVPPKSRSESFGANYETSSLSQWSFTTFKIGVTFKFGRLKAVQRIDDAKKGGQTDRL